MGTHGKLNWHWPGYPSLLNKLTEQSRHKEAIKHLEKQNNQMKKTKENKHRDYEVEQNTVVLYNNHLSSSKNTFFFFFFFFFKPDPLLHTGQSRFLSCQHQSHLILVCEGPPGLNSGPLTLLWTDHILHTTLTCGPAKFSKRVQLSVPINHRGTSNIFRPFMH